MQPNNQIPNYQPVGQQPVMPPQPNIGTVPVQLPKDPKPVGLIVAVVIAVLLLIAATIFAVWAYMGMQDYKSNSDKKSAAAVAKAEAAQKTALEAQFAEQEKQPNKTYTSPSQYGSVKLVYPKTWAAYVAESDSSSQPVDGYFYPNFVPNISGKNSYYLRVQVVNTPYQSVVKPYEDKAKQGTVKVSAFKPEQVKDASAGVRVDGLLDSNTKGSMVVLPVRDKTLKIWTENDASAGDFNTIVLKNLSYSP